MFVFHAAPGSADGRRQTAERVEVMTDISLQKTAKTARRGRGRPFQRGQSGNPSGRPRGSSNRATRAAELLLDGEATALTRKAVELALAGDPAALRLCLDRTVAPRTVGRAGSAADPQRNRHPGYGKSDYRRGRARRHHSRRGVALSNMIEALLRAIDASDFERRLRQLEESQAASRQSHYSPAVRYG